MIERRAFLSLAGLALFGAPLAAEAQGPAPKTVYRIGFLSGATPSGYAVLLEALRLGLRDHGYVEGENITIEYRWAEGKYERLPALAAELVRLKVDLIITQGTPAALVAKQATKTIPIVMAIAGNPVETGIVESYARPGGNITGSSFFWGELNAKRLELMKDLNPSLARAGVLMNPDNPAMKSLFDEMEKRAQALNVRLQSVNVRALDQLSSAFDLAKTQVQALIVVEDGLFIANASRIAGLAIRTRLPSIGFREYCDAGGLLAYGVDFPHIWRASADLVDRILKGAKPADLPIQQATRFETVINLKTAKALGLSVPPSLLARADEVIR
ncbi:MAG TPA: ABC transporter substrate-binding protein [Terriglobales bacterium]|nr:ABC transporter substrate-binding protein [Terriglobales bacterium]